MKELWTYNEVVEDCPECSHIIIAHLPGYMGQVFCVDLKEDEENFIPKDQGYWRQCDIALTDSTRCQCYYYKNE